MGEPDRMPFSCSDMIDKDLGVLVFGDVLVLTGMIDYLKVKDIGWF